MNLMLARMMENVLADEIRQQVMVFHHPGSPHFGSSPFLPPFSSYLRLLTSGLIRHRDAGKA
jgi:hypothetical protein